MVLQHIEDLCVQWGSQSLWASREVHEIWAQWHSSQCSGGWGRFTSVSSSPSWSIFQVPEQPGIHSKILSQKGWRKMNGVGVGEQQKKQKQQQKMTNGHYNSMACVTQEKEKSWRALLLIQGILLNCSSGEVEYTAWETACFSNMNGQYWSYTSPFRWSARQYWSGVLPFKYHL